MRFSLKIGIPLLALFLGLAEAGFIFLARWGLNGGGLRILTGLSILVLLRFLLQDEIAKLEVRAMREKVSGLRNKLSAALRRHAVPAYRTEFQTALKHALNETLPRIGEGLLARRRVHAAALQGLILIPCLFFFSWRLAALALLLAVPASFAIRWRGKSLRRLERAEMGGRGGKQFALNAFTENLESLCGGNALEAASEKLNGELDRAQIPEWQWRTAQARYPALLEAGFFFALAGLILLGGSTLSSWEGWILFSGLLLLAYKPVREAARYYPVSLQGRQAEDDFEKLRHEWGAFPARALPQISHDENQNIFAVDKIHFGYEVGQNIFRNFSFTFNADSVTGIVGPNGAGKTTLLRLLAGVEIPSQGCVYWTKAARDFGSIAYLPQRISVGNDWPRWARELKASQPARWAQLDGVLHLDRLLSKSEYPEGLSGGERQRMALARALSSDAPFLLMDEPTTALPGNEREQILEGALKLWGRGAVVVSHEPFLSRLCDEVVDLTSKEVPEISAVLFDNRE